jgi:hypothetical protein
LSTETLHKIFRELRLFFVFCFVDLFVHSSSFYIVIERKSAMHRFLAQPIVMTDFGGPESLGELLSTLSQLEATVNQVPPPHLVVLCSSASRVVKLTSFGLQVLSQISGRVEEEKQKVDAVGVRLDSCRGRLHGLAQERYNKATVVTYAFLFFVVFVSLVLPLPWTRRQTAIRVSQVAQSLSCPGAAAAA